MRVVLNKGILEIYADVDDICYKCSNMNKCPLMAALQNEVVLMRFGDISIEECGLFKEQELDELLY